MITMQAVLFLCIGFVLTCLGKWLAVQASNPGAASSTHVALRKGKDGRMRPYRAATVREAYHYQHPTKSWVDVETANMYFFVIGSIVAGAVIGALWSPSFSMLWYIGLAASIAGSALALLSLLMYPDGWIKVPIFEKLYYPILLIILFLMILLVVQTIFWPETVLRAERMVLLVITFLPLLLLILDWVLPRIVTGSANKKAQKLLYSMVGDNRWNNKVVDEAAEHMGGYYSLLDFIRFLAKEGRITDDNFLDQLQDIARMR